MTIETKAQSVIPQGEMGKPVNPPVPRVTMVPTTENLEDADSFQKLTLKIDGKQIKLRRNWLYPTKDALSVIKLATGINDPHLVKSFVRDIINSKAIKAEKIKLEGKMTYRFNEENLLKLIEMLLRKIDPYVSLSKEPIALPDGQPLDRLTTLQYALMKLLTKAKEQRNTVKESDLATLYQDLPREEAISRSRGSIYTMRMRLKQHGWMIRNHTSRPDLIQGKESEYELMPIVNRQRKDSVPTKKSQERILGDLPETNATSDASSKAPLTDRGREAIAKAKENLELESTYIILNHFAIMKNLQQFEANLFSFLKRNLTSRPPYDFSLQDIIQVPKPEYSKAALKKFFIDFLRRRLRDASTMSRQKEFTSSLERKIKKTYDSITLDSNEDKIEGIIQIICGHFYIEYEEPTNPATSSPAS